MKSNKINILSIGNELLNGKTTNTNLTYIGEKLNSIGYEINYCLTIRDDETSFFEAISFLYQTADTIICSGGLGPTQDDLTRDFIAKYFEEDLVEFQEARGHLEKILSAFKVELLDFQMRQALFPKISELLANPLGTALGFKTSKNGKTLYSVPGVPYELQHIMENSILPDLKSEDAYFYSRSILTFNIGEARQTELMGDFQIPEGVTLASLPSPSGLRFSYSTYQPELRSEVDRCMDYTIELFGDNGHKQDIISESTIPLVEQVIDNLKTKGISLSVAESCTGGKVSGLITQIPGVSSIFKGGVVAYENSIKQDLLGVQKSTLQEFGAVSEQTAKEMAEGVRHRCGSQIGMATTGIAGPDGGTNEKPVGLIWFAISAESRTVAFKKVFKYTRNLNQERASYYLFDQLRRFLMDSI